METDPALTFIALPATGRPSDGARNREEVRPLLPGVFTARTPEPEQPSIRRFAWLARGKRLAPRQRPSALRVWALETASYDEVLAAPLEML